MSRQPSTSPALDANRFTITDYYTLPDVSDTPDPNVYVPQASSSRSPLVYAQPRRPEEHPTLASASAPPAQILQRAEVGAPEGDSRTVRVRRLPAIPVEFRRSPPSSVSSPITPITNSSSSPNSATTASPTTTVPPEITSSQVTPPSAAPIATVDNQYRAQDTRRRRLGTMGQRQGSGNSGARLQLHEPAPPLTASGYPAPMPPHLTDSTTRSSTEINPLPSLHSLSSGPSDTDTTAPARIDEEGDASQDVVEMDEDYIREKELHPLPVIPASPKRRVVDETPVGLWRTLWGDSWACRALLFTVVFQAVVDLAIEANILWRFNNEVDSSNTTDRVLANRRRLPIYLCIFGLAHLWQLALTLVSIRSKNTIQVMALTLFNYAFLAYAVLMTYELRKILGDLNTSLRDEDPTAPTDEIFTIPLNVLTAVVMGVLAVGSLTLTLLAWRIRKEFGWQRYRFLGADLQIRKLYQRFQIFECICYFTAFFCAGFGIQFIWLVLQPTDVEFIITWIMFPLSLILLIVGRFAAKYEKKWLMYVFLSGTVLGLAYFIFKLVRIWQRRNTVYRNLTLSLTVFDCISIVLLSASAGWGIAVGQTFGRGLKEAVLNSPHGSILKMWRTKSVTSEKSPNGSYPYNSGDIEQRGEKDYEENEMKEMKLRRISID